MKELKILMVLIGVIISSSCSTTRYRNIHLDLALQTPCIFEKFTEEEKQVMSEPIGQKIYRNQQSCKIRYQKNYDIISAHNEAHKGE